MWYSAIELLNLFGFAVGSMSLTIAIFYGFFVNVHNKNIDQSNKLAKAINTLYAELKEQHEHLLQIDSKLRDQAEDLEALQIKVDVSEAFGIDKMKVLTSWLEKLRNPYDGLEGREGNEEVDGDKERNTSEPCPV